MPRKRIATNVRSAILNTVKYLSGLDAPDKVAHVAEKQGLTQAISYLKSRYKIFKPAPVRFLIALYTYRLALSKRLETYAPPKKTYIIHFCVWGENYTDTAVELLLPSLLADNNIPLLAKTHDITLLIHCDSDAQKAIQQSPTVIRLSNYARFDFQIVPEKILRALQKCQHYPAILPFSKKLNSYTRYSRYAMLGALQTHALEIATHNKAFISFLMPDFLLADSVLQKAFEKIENRKAVVSTMYRTSLQEIHQQMNAYRGPDNKISISSPALTKYCISYIHKQASRQIVSEENTSFTPCPQLIFKDPQGYVIRSLHYHPILVDCDKLNNQSHAGYRPIDSCFFLDSESTSNFGNDIWVCPDANEMAILECSAPMESMDEKKSATHLSYEQLICATTHMISSNLNTFDRSIYRYYASIRHKVTSDEPRHIEGYIDDCKFINTVYSQIDKQHAPKSSNAFYQ